MKAWKPQIVQRRLKKSALSAVHGWIRVGSYDLEDWEFTGDEAGAADFYGITFTRCVFRRCSLPGAKLRQCGFIDSILEGCDLSNTDLEESFWQRCVLTDCRLVGTRLGGARLRQVRLTGCAAGFSGFDRAVLQSVRMEGCDLQEAYLRFCKCRELEADRCSFLKTNFYQTPLAGVDFTTSEIGGWTLSENAPELRGAVVSPVQAVELAGRLGLVVKTGGDSI